MLREQCDDSNITLGMSILFCAFSVGLLTGPCLAGMKKQYFISEASYTTIFTLYRVSFQSVMMSFIIYNDVIKSNYMRLNDGTSRQVVFLSWWTLKLFLTLVCLWTLKTTFWLKISAFPYKNNHNEKVIHLSQRLIILGFMVFPAQQYPNVFEKGKVNNI